MDGWIKLHRKSIENGWLQNHKLWAFWSYCLMKASHKNHTQFVGCQQVILKPGQFVFGLNSVSKELKISPQSLRTIVKFLKNNENLTIKPTNKYSVITVCNWKSYQGNEKENQQTTNIQLTSNQHSTNNKQERKKERNIHKLQGLIENNYPKLKKLELQLTNEQSLKLDKDYTREQIINIFNDMENWKKIHSKTSVYLTALNWLKRAHPKSKTPVYW